MKLKEFFVKQKITPNKKDAESGRSMVEMLGVLAIIGVLSIGGIAGYTLAMNRYRANEILDVAAKVSVLALSKQDCDDEHVCANMNEATSSRNVAGAEFISSYQDGTVLVVGYNISEGTFNAIKSIAGNKLVDDFRDPTYTSFILNFARY